MTGNANIAGVPWQLCSKNMSCRAAKRRSIGPLGDGHGYLEAGNFHSSHQFTHRNERLRMGLGK